MPDAASPASGRPGSGVRQMIATSQALKPDDGLEVLWSDAERVVCRERRLTADGKLNSVLIVKLTAEHPRQASLEQLTHE
jgi:hypothetical protein